MVEHNTTIRDFYQAFDRHHQQNFSTEEEESEAYSLLIRQACAAMHHARKQKQEEEYAAYVQLIAEYIGSATDVLTLQSQEQDPSVIEHILQQSSVMRWL